MKVKLNILFVEDSLSDLELIKYEIKKSGIEFVEKLVETREDYENALLIFKPDIILSDYSLPHFTGMEALEIRQKEAPHTPFILLTGALNEETAVEIMKAGSDDYILKKNLIRLGSAIKSSIDKWETIKARETVEQKLRENENILNRTSEMAKVGGWEFDLQTMKPFMTTQTWQIYEVDHPSMLGPIETAINFYAPQAQPIIRDAIQATVDHGTPFDLELPFITAKGKHIWVRSKGNASMKDGKTIKLIGSIQDITDRKQAEISLKESEEQYRAIVENSHDAIYIYKDLRFLFVNDKTCELSGYTRQEFHDMIIWDIVHPDDRKRVEEYGKKRIALEEAPETYQSRIITKNKDVRDCEFSVRLIPFQNGFAVLGAVRDTTERKIVEKALKENEARLSTLVSNLPGMSYLCKNDTDWTMLFINGACKKLTGYHPEQLVNNKELSYNQIIHPEDREFVGHQVKVGLAKGKHFELEYRIITASGEIKWVWERGVQNKSEGTELDLIEGIIDDITNRKNAEELVKESEEKYHGMVMNLIEGFYSTTFEGKLTEYNTEFLKILGLNPKNDYFGLDLQSFWKYPEARKDYIQKLQKEGFVKNYIIDIVRPDGSPAIIQVNSRLIKDESGNTNKMEGTFLDFSDRFHAEKLLKQSEDQLRKLTVYMDTKTENEKKIIAKEIHDGLGQLLTGLKMDLQWINKKYPKESNILKDKLTSMNNIIDSAVRDVQKLTFSLRPKMLDDLGLVATIQSEAEHFEERTGISCRMISSPESFDIDYNRSSTIYRIIMELLTNIFRHANATKIKIDLEKIENKCTFTVTDNGLGITQDQIENKNSFGLMSISERAKVWNGSVKITGEHNKGTSVKVSIPLNTILL